MAEIRELSDESFADAIAASPGPVVVEFWAAWCGGCRVVAPLLERLAREHPEITVAKVDVDREPWLALEHRVYSIPTVIRFDGGEETLRVSGVPYERLLAALGVGPRIGSAPSSRGRSWRRGRAWRRGTRRSGSAA